MSLCTVCGREAEGWRTDLLQGSQFEKISMSGSPVAARVEYAGSRARSSIPWSSTSLPYTMRVINDYLADHDARHDGIAQQS